MRLYTLWLYPIGFHLSYVYVLSSPALFIEHSIVRFVDAFCSLFSFLTNMFYDFSFSRSSFFGCQSSWETHNRIQMIITNKLFFISFIFFFGILFRSIKSFFFFRFLHSPCEFFELQAICIKRTFLCIFGFYDLFCRLCMCANRIWRKGKPTNYPLRMPQSIGQSGKEPRNFFLCVSLHEIEHIHWSLSTYHSIATTT